MTEQLYWTKYSTVYNMRPEELYGMGKESLTAYSGRPEKMTDFMDQLRRNSSLKHENTEQGFYGTEEYIEREDWIPYLGQPMFFIVDIDYVPYNGEEENPLLEKKVK